MRAVLFVTLLVCLMAVFYCQAQEITCPNKIPKEDDEAILIPHPTNCANYFVCDFGRPVVMECPDDLHFNPKEKVCDFPWNAGCTAHK